MNETQTLSNVKMINGVLHAVFKHSDGREELRPIVEEGSQSITELFADTDTFPSDWQQQQEATTVARAMTKPLTNSQHVERSHKLEGMMVKYFSASEATGSFDTKGNTVLKAILKDLAAILGGEWNDKIKVIK